MGKRVLLVAGFSVAAAVAVGGGSVFAAKQVRANIAAGQQCNMVQNIEDRLITERREAAGDNPTVVVLGDSYAQGVGLDDPMTAYPYGLGNAVLVNGSGGSGYVSDGPCDNAAFIDRVDALVDSQPATLIVQAGINDRGHDVREAAGEVFDRALSLSPRTRIVVVGPFAPASVAGPDLDAVAAQLREAAEVRNLDFVDPSGWEFTLQNDGLHPSRDGHRAIAEDLAAAL